MPLRIFAGRLPRAALGFFDAGRPRSWPGRFEQVDAHGGAPEYAPITR
jgi:hypothetical protein